MKFLQFLITTIFVYSNVLSDVLIFVKQISRFHWICSLLFYIWIEIFQHYVTNLWICICSIIHVFDQRFKLYITEMKIWGYQRLKWMKSIFFRNNSFTPHILLHKHSRTSVMPNIYFSRMVSNCWIGRTCQIEYFVCICLKKGALQKQTLY